jgi:phenylacetate-coenzyme A ligase PaaK-like adenylate-forming protein
MVAYETLQKRHAQQVAALVPEHQQRIMWPADRLRAERDARLRSLIGYAKERSRWHRDRLAHIDAGSLTADDFRSIPPMTKDDMMANFDAILRIRACRVTSSSPISTLSRTTSTCSMSSTPSHPEDRAARAASSYTTGTAGYSAACNSCALPFESSAPSSHLMSCPSPRTSLPAKLRT